MSNFDDILITVSCDPEDFYQAIERMIDAVEAWTSCLDTLLLGLTPAARTVYDVAAWFGFYPFDILEWLSTCPGACRSEFGDGWQRE